MTGSERVQEVKKEYGKEERGSDKKKERVRKRWITS